jgi:hypothetical protein
MTDNNHKDQVVEATYPEWQRLAREAQQAERERKQQAEEERKQALAQREKEIYDWCAEVLRRTLIAYGVLPETAVDPHEAGILPYKPDKIPSVQIGFYVFALGPRYSVGDTWKNGNYISVQFYIGRELPLDCWDDDGKRTFVFSDYDYFDIVIETYERKFRSYDLLDFARQIESVDRLWAERSEAIRAASTADEAPEDAEDYVALAKQEPEDDELTNIQAEIARYQRWAEKTSNFPKLEDQYAPSAILMALCDHLISRGDTAQRNFQDTLRTNREIASRYLVQLTAIQLLIDGITDDHLNHSQKNERLRHISKSIHGTINDLMKHVEPSRVAALSSDLPF